LQKILVESRAEFATEQKLLAYKKAIGNKKLEIAFGLESANDEVRNHYLKKGMSRQTFESAVALCKAQGIEVFAYVFLKAHCLTEEGAIQDAIESIKYCFEKGVDEVSLSCAFIQPHTLLHKLWKEGKYQPPELSSIVKVIEATANLGPVRIGSFDDDPPPIAKPSNLDSSDEKFILAIDLYRKSHDVKVFEVLTPRPIS
jgi:radical SAM enzyme (TIGR01210 family)